MKTKEIYLKGKVKHKNMEPIYFIRYDGNWLKVYDWLNEFGSIELYTQKNGIIKFVYDYNGKPFTAREGDYIIFDKNNNKLETIKPKNFFKEYEVVAIDKLDLPKKSAKEYIQDKYPLLAQQWYQDKSIDCDWICEEMENYAKYRMSK